MKLLMTQQIQVSASLEDDAKVDIKDLPIDNWMQEIPVDYTRLLNKPVLSSRPKYEDLPRDAEGNVADITFDDSSNLSFHGKKAKRTLIKVKDGQIFDTRGNKLKLEDGVYGLSKFDSINVPTSEEYLKVFKPEDLNQVGQTIEVDCGVVVSDSLGKMVGLKINLASGCWEYSVDGNWIAI